MASIPRFTDGQLERLSKILGETHGGLTGSEIDGLLARCQIENRLPDATKWKRLLAAFGQSQETYKSGAHVLRFIKETLEPARWTADEIGFNDFRTQLNEVLSFSGLQIDARGQPILDSKARTITEAQQRAHNLRAELLKRGVHPDILRYCQAELIGEGNYFHAVLEASKGLADRLREKCGLTLDGNQLVQESLTRPSVGHPRIAFNSLRTQSEISEHDGLMHLFKGVFSAFRNPTAHEPRVTSAVNEQDALDLLSLASFLSRRLESSVSTKPPPP